MEKGSSAGADVSTAWQDRRDGDTVNASASLVMILRPLGGSVSQPAVRERERASGLKANRSWSHHFINVFLFLVKVFFFF